MAVLYTRVISFTPFVFPSSSLLFKEIRINDHKTNFAPLSCMDVRKLVFRIEGITHIEGVWEQGAEESIESKGG
jgi:hypothetical protein